MVETYTVRLDDGLSIASPTINVNDLPGYNAISTYPQVISPTWNGDKFYNGFGDTSLFGMDYWTLRARSAQLFDSNLYARGILRRFVTNVINVGLSLESTVIEDVLRAELGAEFDAIGTVNDWTENVENRFQIWANAPDLCDFYERETFGSLQRSAYLEALISGDVLCVLYQDRRTSLPKLQLIRGDMVETPMNAVAAPGNKIDYGVETDSRGRQVAYWVRGENLTSTRINAFGPRSGRRVAWLMYGTDRRMGTVRGMPILGIVLQSLKEIDRYRDSEQRAAVINSMIAMFVRKTTDKMGTKPLTGGAQRRDVVTTTDSEGAPRQFNAQTHIPGMVFDELQMGEEPVSFNNMRPNVNFSTFEAAVIYAMAWALEIPPEVLTLAFSKNYSASRGAVNEYKIFLQKERARVSDELPRLIYESWFLAMVLMGKLEAPGFLDAWRDPLGYDVYGAWLSSDWTGAIKPSIDLEKEVKAYDLMVASGYMTREKATKELTGTKYSKNVRRLEAENEQLVRANMPLQALNPPAAPPPGPVPRNNDEEDNPEDMEDGDNGANVRQLKKGS